MERIKKALIIGDAMIPGNDFLPAFEGYLKGSAAPFWNRYAKGVLFNLTLTTTRSDMARAILESIVFEMGANLNLVREILP